MNREQMIAWLCLEGWEPRWRKSASHYGIMRGSERVSAYSDELSAYYMKDSLWVNDSNPVPWDVFKDNTLGMIYEQARLL